MRLGVLATHPIQNHAPIFRELVRRCDLTVYFAHRQTPEGQARAGFGVAFDWDVDLLSGYPSLFLENRSRRPGTNRFFGCDTPEVDRLIGQGGFDAFLVSGWNVKSYWQAARACRRRGIPVLIRGDSQLSDTRRLPVRVVKKLVYPPMLRAFDGFCYVGQRNYQYLRHYGAPPDRLFFSPHCIDNDAFADAAASSRLEPASRSTNKPWRLLFCGKLMGLKRTLDIVEAAAVLSAQGHPSEVVFAGSGEMLEPLRQRAGALGVRSEFLGFRNQSQLPAIYAAADILILPSERETWGLVVNEAMACGIPAAISNAVGCGPDLIEPGRTGATFPVGDIAALAEGVRSILTLDRATVRRHVTEKVAAYSPAAAAEGILRAGTSFKSSRAV